jgi:Protein of unknown function (DUF4241)
VICVAHCEGSFLPYPNVDFWSALHDGRRVPVGEGKHYVLSIVDCGFLHMPTGRLVACDPFAGLQETGNRSFEVHPGRYRVLVTLADVSDANDNSHIREAYATLMLDETAIEATRRIITPSGAAACPPEMDDDGTYHGFPVDAGTACFVDQGAIEALMPDGDWYENIFDDGTPNSWFARMDDPNHIRDGIANIPLPLASQGENIIIFHSGWGDGLYPVVGGYDGSDRLVRMHIDFLVVFPHNALGL